LLGAALDAIGSKISGSLVGGQQQPQQQMEKRPMLHKMSVTGPRCAEFITQPLDVMRELNPSLNTTIQSTEGMKKILSEAAKQPSTKRRKIASTAVAVHDAHLQRLKAFKDWL
jgi:hypothetical protein